MPRAILKPARSDKLDSDRAKNKTPLRGSALRNHRRIFDRRGSTSGSARTVWTSARWIRTRLAFPSRGITDGITGEREETRKSERAGEATAGGGGVGININIIALIALDRGGARACDTLQITHGGSSGGARGEG